MSFFKNMFQIQEKEHFLLGNGDQETISQFAETLLEISNNSLKQTIPFVLQVIDENKLTKTIKSVKPFNLILLSYEIACFLYSVSYNSKISDKKLLELGDKVMSNTLDITNEQGSIWEESDIPHFKTLASNYYESIHEFVRHSGAVLSGGPGRIIIDDLLEMYQQPNDSIDVFDKNKLASLLHVNISSSIESLGNAGLKWVE